MYNLFINTCINLQKSDIVIYSKLRKSKLIFKIKKGEFI